MKFSSIHNNALLVLAGLALSSAGWAGGNHAGGHGQDEDAIGKPGVAAKASRTIAIDMADTMRFTPASLSVRQGETVRFIVKNSGKLKHEFVLGTEKTLEEHYELMKKFPEMEHADANMVTVEPGQTGEVVWQFSKAGKIGLACLQPGHYDAGMKGFINVSSTKMTNKEDGHGDHKH